ncbi:MAG TPA: hypothetical protein VEK08_12230 [Planctomycetota bacterium]|nr:hypothetical protein [Planctomycetota bacterium]
MYYARVGGVRPLGVAASLVLMGVLAAGFLAGLLRLLISIFGESRIAMLEMILSSLFFSAVTIAVLKCLHFETWLISRQRQLILQLMTVAILLIVCACGSAWAWGLAGRYQINDARQRLLILVYGWLLGIGVLCVTTFTILAVISLTSKTGLHPDLRDLYIASSLGAPLSLPGVFCALMLRRHARAITAAASKN